MEFESWCVTSKEYMHVLTGLAFYAVKLEGTLSVTSWKSISGVQYLNVYLLNLTLEGADIHCNTHGTRPFVLELKWDMRVSKAKSVPKKLTF